MALRAPYEHPMIDTVTRMITRPWALFIQSLQNASNGGAPNDAQYLVAATNSDLTAERVATTTATVAWDFATAGQAKANVPDNAITDAKLRQSAALSVVGRSANSTGNVADIAAASDGQVLRRSGTAVGFGAVDLASANAVTGVLPVANGGTFLQRATVTLTDAQIKALGGGTTYQLVAAPAAGSLIRVITATLSINASAGAYTNVDTTYATLQVQNTDGAWLQTVLANDSSYTTPLTRATDFFTVADTQTALLSPYLEAIQSGGGSGDWGYAVPPILTGTTPTAIELAMDNNGSGDLTGGNAANTLTATVTYLTEAL